MPSNTAADSALCSLSSVAIFSVLMLTPSGYLPVFFPYIYGVNSPKSLIPGTLTPFKVSAFPLTNGSVRQRLFPYFNSVTVLTLMGARVTDMPGSNRDLNADERKGNAVNDGVYRHITPLRAKGFINQCHNCDMVYS